MRSRTVLMLLLLFCAVCGAEEVGRGAYVEAVLFFALCLLFAAALLRERRLARRRPASPVEGATVD